MVVRRSQLATARVSWDEKADSITAIADELSLGTASFVLIDDSPIECEKVTFQLPEVRALQMPEDAVGWFDAIARSGALDRLPPNETDRLRVASYQQEADRRVLRSSTSMEDFLASLELRVEIRPLAAADVPRVAQLIAKTNQFTLAGRRRSESEVSTMVGDSRFAGYAVSCSDRFGDYGTVGAMVVDRAPDGDDVPAGAAVLDTFVLSCRAMGRGVETAMLAGAFDGAPTIWTTVEEAPRNQPARDFFAGHGCADVGARCELRRPAWPAHVNAGSPQAS
jgi:FkbH-like protein